MSTHALPPSAAMMKIVTGYWLSQAVGVVAKLGVADLLAGGPRSTDDLARETKSNPDALYRLLRCCASAGIFQLHEGRRFALTPLGETLCSASVGSVKDFAIAETAPGHWLPWGKMEQAVRTGKPTTTATLGSDIFGFYAKNPDEAAPFARAMGNLAALAAAEVVNAIDVSKAQTIVDVGGANGTLLAAALASAPKARGIVLDLPHVVADATEYLAARKLGDRVEIVGGDFFATIPSGDVLFLKQILHDWDDERAIDILETCSAALQPGGRLMVVEMIVPRDNAPSMAQLMDLNMLVMLTGRERTEEEFAALFGKAGLVLERVTATHSPFSVIEVVRK